MAQIDPTILYAPDFAQRIQTDQGGQALQRFLIDLYTRVGGPEDAIQGTAETVATQGSTITSLEAETTSLTAQIASNDADITALETAVNNLIAVAAAFTVTNGSTDRAYDANSTTLEELADVLGTLIADIAAQPGV